MTCGQRAHEVRHREGEIGQARAVAADDADDLVVGVGQDDDARVGVGAAEDIGAIEARDVG